MRLSQAWSSKKVIQGLTIQAWPQESCLLERSLKEGYLWEIYLWASQVAQLVKNLPANA